ncbi:heme lyase subunit NrfE [Escherichia coli]|nr:heme lyase subunit NrfE [Escherichia coli]
MSPNIATACCRGNSNWRRCGAVMKVRCCFGCCCFPPGAALFAWQYRQQTDPLFPLTLAVLSLMLAALLLFVVLWSDPLRADISTSNRRPRSQSDAATSRSYLSSTAALPWLWRFDGSGERGAGRVYCAASLMVPAPEFAGAGRYLAGVH